MKHLNTIIFTFIFISNIHCVFSAETSVFTTIASPSEKMSYVAVKKMSKGNEPESSLMEIESEKMISKKITLPNDLVNREIVSLIPTLGDQLLVLTQYTMEQGDHPRIHLFNPGKKTWTSVGVVACVSFSKIKLELDKIIFSCEETDEKGEVKLVDKDVKIPSSLLKEKSDIQLPIAKLEIGSLKAQFEGLPQEWVKLKLTYKNKEKSFTP